MGRRKGRWGCFSRVGVVTKRGLGAGDWGLGIRGWGGFVDGFVGGRGFWFGFIGLGVGNGFVWEIIPGSFADEALEVFDGAAVLALDLGVVAEDERPHRGLCGHPLEAFRHGVVAVLGAMDVCLGV